MRIILMDTNFVNFEGKYKAHLNQIPTLGPEMGAVAIYDIKAGRYLDPNPYGSFANEAIWVLPRVWLQQRGINLDLCEVTLHWR